MSDARSRHAAPAITIPAVDVVRQVHASLGRHDLEALAEVTHERATADLVPLDLVLVGWETIRNFYAELFDALPDLELSTSAVHPVGDDRAFAEWEALGTFVGRPFQGLAPTGRSVHLRGAAVVEVADGLLLHQTVYADGLRFVRDLGLLPAVESPANRAVTRAVNAVTRARRIVRR